MILRQEFVNNKVKTMKNTGIKLISILAVAGALLFAAGCMPEPDKITSQEQLNQYIAAVDQNKLATDIKAIDDTLAKWALTAQIEPKGGVRYIVHTLGTGAKPTLDDQIQVKYTGKLLSNKNVFDSNDTGATFPLNRLIVGWQTTLPLLPEGTIVTLYVPSGLAYGPQAYKDQNGNELIPANSNLIFDLELVKVY